MLLKKKRRILKCRSLCLFYLTLTHAVSRTLCLNLALMLNVQVFDCVSVKRTENNIHAIQSIVVAALDIIVKCLRYFSLFSSHRQSCTLNLVVCCCFFFFFSGCCYFISILFLSNTKMPITCSRYNLRKPFVFDWSVVLLAS